MIGALVVPGSTTEGHACLPPSTPTRLAERWAATCMREHPRVLSSVGHVSIVGFVAILTEVVVLPADLHLAALVVALLAFASTGLIARLGLPANASATGRPARPAPTEQLVHVAVQLEAEPVGHVALHGLDRLRVELHDDPAATADEVVVVLPLERALVLRALRRRGRGHL